MKRNDTVPKMEDRKRLLSTLWIFLMVNYIYTDIYGFMEPGTIEGLMAGQLGSMEVTHGVLLAGAILMQIPSAMIVLSWVLKYRANRWANIIAATIMIAVQVGTMGMGTELTPVYIFYSLILIAFNSLIVWLAWRWKPESQPLSAANRESSLQS